MIGGLVDQDLSVHLTLSVERMDMWLTLYLNDSQNVNSVRKIANLKSILKTKSLSD